MAAKRSRRGWGQQASEPPPSKKARPLDVVAPQASLAYLPDDVLVHIMWFLDVESLVRLSRVCRRLNQLFGDERLWRDVDLSFVARRDGHVRSLRKFVRLWLGPATEVVRVKSNASAARCRRGRGTRPPPPLVTASLLDEVVERCPRLAAWDIRDCDLTQFPASCLFFHCRSVTEVNARDCITELRWLGAARWPALTRLSLARTVKTSDADLAIIAEKWGNSLRSLDLEGCYRITDGGVRLLCERLGRLSRLDVSGCKGLTGDCVPHLGHLGRLKTLSLARLPNVLSAAGPVVLSRALSRLSCMNLSEPIPGLADLMPNVTIVYVRNNK